MENKNMALLTKQTDQKGCSVRYNKFIRHFDEIALNKDYNSYFNLLTRRTKGDYHIVLDANKFNERFYDNFYNFLDLMFCFTVYLASQNIGVFYFLVSNHSCYKQYGQIIYLMEKDKHNFLKDNSNTNFYKHKCLSDNSTIKNRQLFVLAFLDLIKDYFSICNKIEKKDKKEQLLISLFEDIFLDNSKLINNFRNFRNNTPSRVPVMEKIDIIQNKYNVYKDQIGEIKDKILNYYNVLLLDKTVSNVDRVRYFTNCCNNGLNFDLVENRMSCFVYRNLHFNKSTNTYTYTNNLALKQFYRDLNNACDEISKTNEMKDKDLNF